MPAAVAGVAGVAELAKGRPIRAVFLEELRGRVLEAWQGGTAGTDIRWLVADQLGTPRMVVDGTGSLAGVTRHDYLPFGEELSAGTGGRTTNQGYSVSDNVRQKYAGSERDGETGLDYMKARYYSSMQGRFTSVDPSGKSIIPTNPQTWNRYSYTYNNPLRYVDKNGKWPTGTHDKIIATAFDGLRRNQPDKLRQIQKGSASVDTDLSKPVKLATENTEIESLAYRHAMTPGFMVAKLGSVSAAQEWARGKATEWITQNMDGAKSIYNNSQNKDRVPDSALQAFGAGAHTIMDGSSPAHRDFQVFNLVQVVPPMGTDAGSLLGAAVGTVVISVQSQVEHGDIESRQPTDEEMNHMVDDMRMQYLNAFGREMYEQAVSPAEREATERRRNPQR